MRIKRTSQIRSKEWMLRSLFSPKSLETPLVSLPPMKLLGILFRAFKKENSKFWELEMWSLSPQIKNHSPPLNNPSPNKKCFHIQLSGESQIKRKIWSRNNFLMSFAGRNQHFQVVHKKTKYFKSLIKVVVRAS